MVDGDEVCSFGALEVMAARLPEPLHEPATVWDGKQLWIFGGLTAGGVFSDRILRYDPAQDRLVQTDFRLPSGRHAMAAVWTGERVLLFGGRRSHGSLLDEIVAFDPGTGKARVLDARLPTGRYNLGAALLDGDVYLFGGFDYSYLSDVLRFDPRTRSLSRVAALPTGTEAPSVIVAGSEARVLGGYTGARFLDAVTRFDPRSGAVEAMPDRLPFRAWVPAFMQLGSRGYLYGGVDGVKSGPAIRKMSCYDVDTGATAISDFDLPAAHVGMATAVVDGAQGFVIGGSDPETGQVKDTIVRFTP